MRRDYAKAIAGKTFEGVRDAQGVAGGSFGADMLVDIANDGPVTIIGESCIPAR